MTCLVRYSISGAKSDATSCFKTTPFDSAMICIDSGEIVGCTFTEKSKIIK